jgi:hypothetical protein
VPVTYAAVVVAARAVPSIVDIRDSDGEHARRGPEKSPADDSEATSTSPRSVARDIRNAARTITRRLPNRSAMPTTAAPSATPIVVAVTVGWT